MRDNFGPNVRLTTNILIVIVTFSIAFNLDPIAKQVRIRLICLEGITAFTSQYSGIEEDYYRNKFLKLDRQVSKLTKIKKRGIGWENLKIVFPVYTDYDWKKSEEYYKKLDK